MSLLGGEGFSLPLVSETEVVDVILNFSDSAKQALVESMNGDEESHVLVISAQSGGCSGYLYEMKIVEDPKDENFQRIDVSGIGVLVQHLIRLRVLFRPTPGGRRAPCRCCPAASAGTWQLS